MALARHMLDLLSSGSFIRKMFETGLRLKKEFGEDKVFDFSLGNPSLLPPQEFSQALVQYATKPFAGKHAYMPNAGYPDVREAVSNYLGSKCGVKPGARGVVMSCGAGGGLNAVLKSILNPLDRVLASLPCFMEYRFYAQNHGGRLETVPCKDDFSLDAEAFSKALGPDVAGVIVNSPNNPSGKIYDRENLLSLVRVLDESYRKTGRRIYLISDEPYRSLAYGKEVPEIFSLYSHSIIVSSASKELSIPGERIGWVAVHPAAEDAEALVDAIIFSTRVLGFVNAPALMQKTLAATLGATADMQAYWRKRDLLCPALRSFGYELEDPEGTFYAFPKSPLKDDVAFVEVLQKQNILCVPGSGFGMPGYFRIAYCQDDELIRRSLPGFEAAINYCKGRSS